MKPIINNKVNDMKTEIYKKVYIRSEEDLPKEEKEYFVGLKGNYDRTIDVYCYYSDNDIAIKQWMDNIDWYLQPIEITDEP